MVHHRALDNYDILCEIFSHLEPYSGAFNRGIRLATLARAARVCKSFSEPALDTLWRNLGDDVLQLFRMLPGFRQSRTADEHQLTGRIPDSSLLRFNSYAQRVRDAQMWDIRLCSVVSAPDIRSGGALFPLLRTLEWTQADIDDLSLVALLPPSLQILSLNLSNKDDGPDVAEGLLGTVASGAPHLRALHIRLWKARPLCCLPSFTKITRLTVSLYSDTRPLDTKGLRAILALTQLEELIVHATYYEDESVRGELANLRKLDLRSPFHGGSMCSLMASIIAPALQNLCLRNRFCNETISDNHECAEMAAMCYGASLRSISFAGMPGGKGPITPVLAMFRSLLSMRHIERVYLQVPSYRLSLCDTETQEIATAWPQLKSFNVDSHSPQFEPSWSIPLIAPFVRLCPDLEVLRVACEITEPSGGGQMPHTGSTALQQLEISISYVDVHHPERLAEQFSFLCPKVDMNLSLQYEPWKKVRAVMRDIVQYSRLR